MAEYQKRTRSLAVLIVFLILSAYALRLPFLMKNLAPEFLRWTTWIRSCIYICLFAAWGVSIKQRVIHRQACRFLIASAALMVFWIFIRHIKFSHPQFPFLTRFCWYLYYVPLTLIPLTSCMAVSLAGKADHCPVSKRWFFGWIAAGLIVLLVLTNDLHQLVFRFPAGHAYYEYGEYNYGPGFLLAAGWGFGSLLAILNILFSRCRLPNRGRRLLLPMIPALLLAIYSVLYWFRMPGLPYLFGDMAVIECLLMVCIFECCIRTGLIRSNTRYLELFHASAAKAMVLDQAYRPIAASEGCIPLPESILRSSETGARMLDHQIRLVSAPITDGRVFWTEDVSELTAAARRLSEIRTFLMQKRGIMEQELESSRQKYQASERRRLYDEILQQTETEIQQYDALISALEAETSPETVRKIVARIIIFCAYIKRKISLIFQAMEDGSISAGQFEICVCKDLLPGICASGAVGDYSSACSGGMPVWSALTFFKAIFASSILALDSLESIAVRLSKQKNMPVLEIRMQCSCDLTVLESPELSVSGDGKNWTLIAVPGQKDAV